MSATVAQRANGPAAARRRRPLGIALALLLLAGCASWFERPATREEQLAYQRAERARADDPDAARVAFEDFLARFPDGPLSDDAALALAEIAQRAGDLDEAQRRYREVALAGGDAGDRARVQLATLALERGDDAQARAWLGRVRLSRLDEAEQRNAYRALAQSAERPSERLRWLAQLRERTGEPARLADVDAQIDALLAEMPESELRAAARGAGDRPPGARIHLAIAERALAAGDLERAQEALEEAKRRPLDPRYAPRMADAMARLGARTAGASQISDLPTFEQAQRVAPPDLSRARGAIGVVLPLSGPYARFGEAALHGVLLAAGIFPDDGLGPEMRVVVRDSAGDPERAAAAVRELADDPDVVAIVGPLVSKACDAAAAEAESRGVPLLALTAREEIVHGRRWIFRTRTRPVEEAQLVADRAIALGAQRFGILYRDDPYGRGLRALFWDAVESRGGRVVAVSSYDPDATDFAEPIRRLVGYTLLDPEEKRAIAARNGMLERARRLPPSQARALRERARSLTTDDDRPIPPIVDFDALFIPESHDKVVLIAPALAFHEVNGARLLGTVGWYDPSLVRLAGEHVEGALFASDFFPESPVPYVGAFRERFEGRFGSAPDAFAAQAYDAASLVLLQLARGRDERDEVRDGVLRVESYPGVAGVVTMSADGNANRRPYLLRVEDGQIVQVVD